MTDLAALVVRMQADNSQYVKALDQATQRLSKFQKDQEGLLGDLAQKFAAAFTIDKILAFTESAIESQASLAKFSQIAGVSVENLSGLSAAFAAAGLTQDDMSMSFKKLNEAISQAAGDSTSKAGIAFKLLGVNVNDANGNIKDAATVNAEVADAFSHTQDGANKVAIAVALFGRAGQNMIPILDKGSAGLKQFQQDAIDMGAAVSGDAAQAALELEEKLNALESNIKGGLGNAIASNLVPALLAMGDAFGNASEKGAAIAALGEGIANVLKIAAGIALEVAREFDLLGNAIGGAAAAVVAAAHGNFSEAKSILQDESDQAAAINAKFAKAQAALWDQNAQAQIMAAQKGAAGAADAQKSGALGSLEGGVKSAAADKELEKFSTGLKDQAAAFGLGAEASTRYKLSFGPLADALKIAGDAGKAAAASAITYAKALQFKIDTKTSTDLEKSLQEQIDKLDQSDVAAFKYKITTGELGDAFKRMGASGAAAQANLTTLSNRLIDDKDAKAVQAINDQLDQMNGKLVEAAGHSFDLQNKSLTQNLTARGDTTGLAAVQSLKDKTVAQAAYNEQVEKGQQIEATFAAQDAVIQAQQAAGQITDLQAQKQLNDARLEEINGLQGVYAAEKQIADTSGIQKLADSTKAFATQIVNLKTQTDLLEKSVRDGLESAFANNFADLITGAKSFRDALQGFLKDIEKQFADLVSKNFAQQLFGAGGAAGGAPGVLAGLFGGGSLSSLFGGGSNFGVSNAVIPGVEQNAGLGGGIGNIVGNLDGFADGGTLAKGNWGIVGENGPELAYSGSKDMQIVPGGSFGAKPLNVTNHFSIQAPGGQIGRASQMQTAAAAARSLQQASRRNNT